VTSFDISKLIEREIAGDWKRSNAHRVDLRRCLVPPEKRVFEQPFGENIELWLVLEEHPNSKCGYKIVFDEIGQTFGLATSNVKSDRDCFLGTYGTFLETLDAM
jgi:hypothetical protein